MMDVSKVIIGPLADVMRILSNKGVEESGILVGDVKGNVAEVYYIYYTGNIKESSIEFEADPWSVVQAHTSAEKYGLKVIGVFHTHPVCPPAPSTLDREGMKRWPYIWVIACSSGVESWVPVDGGPRRIETV